MSLKPEEIKKLLEEDYEIKEKFTKRKKKDKRRRDKIKREKPTWKKFDKSAY